MRSILYFSIALHYIVCCHLATATVTTASVNAVAQNVSAIPSIGNGSSKNGMLRPLALNNTVRMAPVRASHGRLMVNNELGNEANVVQQTITPVLKTEVQSATYSETNGDVNPEYTNVEETGKETEIFRDGLLGVLKEHLLFSLQMVDDNKIKSLLFLTDFIQIGQNLLNDSVALLYKSALDIKDIMKLYFFVTDPPREVKDEKDSTASQQIGNIKNGIVTKFEDILGSVDISNILHLNELKQIKLTTQNTLSQMALDAGNKIASENNGLVLPGTPYHFICRGLLKWSRLLQSDNQNARRILNKIKRLKQAGKTVRDFIDNKYVLNIKNFDPSAYATLQDVNNVFLSHLYKYTILLAMLIEENKEKLQSSNQQTITSVTTLVNQLHLFFEAFTTLFVERQWTYVIKPQSKPIFEEFKNFLGSITSMVTTNPQHVANRSLELIPELTERYLVDLYVNDKDKWLIVVKGDIQKLLAENNNDISSALTIIRNEAIEDMAFFLDDLNPKWPEPMPDDSNGIITATSPNHNLLSF